MIEQFEPSYKSIVAQDCRNVIVFKYTHVLSIGSQVRAIRSLQYNASPLVYREQIHVGEHFPRTRSCSASRLTAEREHEQTKSSIREQLTEQVK